VIALLVWLTPVKSASSTLFHLTLCLRFRFAKSEKRKPNLLFGIEEFHLNKRKFKVLVFDRDPDALITLQQALENAGVDTTITWDESEIQNLVASAAFDVVLVGDYPPGFTLKAIRDDIESKCVSCPFLVLAASDGEADHFFQLGVTGVVSKRDPSKVLEQVHRFAYSRVA